ncbi:CoA pyrophosphatase [Brevundimonas subvibrioides]|uniref:NUDIX hydrolase n=1 Tax=Brevundimonas subvibrioides (strain ATCC 15264 / DSM 4735 / LMG 14903 / NBRC 16000 / CB 81) TaxID=633149 RepID=D9QM30_BRESC|nr:CoA pyrophosphatase [Brevundimonas subvibrioides]ADL01956.1 NUDIX hydrolase [Brevundimonas subvibrioides ATCC 15264]
MSLTSLKARLIEGLAPADQWRADGAATRSDFDLNPGASRWVEGPLKPAAVLIPVLVTRDGPSVILTRRADSLARHTGQIAFPGGRLDAGETAVEAALREAREEVDLDPGLVQVLGLSDPYETGTGYLVTPVVGWIEAEPALVASPDEVAEIFRTPWDFLMDPSNHSRDHLEAPDGARRWYWSMTWQERYIWGATAGIIRGLRHRLYGEEDDLPAAVAEDAA